VALYYDLPVFNDVYLLCYLMLMVRVLMGFGLGRGKKFFALTIHPAIHCSDMGRHIGLHPTNYV